MLPKQFRLNRKKDFQAVLKKGSRRNYPSFFAIYQSSKDSTEPSRFGFIVSKKVNKKAVERNRVKRRLRAIVGLVVKDTVPGYNTVIIAKYQIMDMSFDRIKEDMNKFLMESGLIKKTHEKNTTGTN